MPLRVKRKKVVPTVTATPAPAAAAAARPDEPKKEEKQVELPLAAPAPAPAADAPVPGRNPKLSQLLAMSSENSSFSFWWDSVDATALKEEDDDGDIDGLSEFNISFDDQVSVRVVKDDDDDEGLG